MVTLDANMFTVQEISSIEDVDEKLYSKKKIELVTQGFRKDLKAGKSIIFQTPI